MWISREASMGQALAGGTVEFEGRIKTKSGETRWVQTRLSAAVAEGNEGLRIMGATSDVTERRRADEERRALDAHLAEAQRLDSLGVLAGGIAHDFNNLLERASSVTPLIARAELRRAEPARTAAAAWSDIEQRRRGAAAELTGQMLDVLGEDAGSVVKPRRSQRRRRLEDTLGPAPRRRSTSADRARARPRTRDLPAVARRPDAAAVRS